jgi:hypothetical protein
LRALGRGHTHLVTMDELCRVVAAFQATGAREHLLWLEQWTRRPDVWKNLPALLGSAFPPHIAPYIGAAARHSCEVAVQPHGWSQLLCGLLLRHSSLISAAVDCDAGAVLAVARSSSSLELATACFASRFGLPSGLKELSPVLLDVPFHPSRLKVWASLCAASGGPVSPFQWDVCFQNGLVEALCEACDRVDPDRLAREMCPRLLLLAGMVKRCSVLLFQAVAKFGTHAETHTLAVRALVHLVAVWQQQGDHDPAFSLLPVLIPLFSFVSARTNEKLVALWQSSQEEIEAEDDDDDLIAESAPYDAALRRLLFIPQLPSSRYDCACKRVARLVSMAALTDAPLRDFLGSSVIKAVSCSTAAECFDGALLFQMYSGCVADDRCSEVLLQMLDRVLLSSQQQQVLSAAQRRFLMQLFALLTSLIELWEERRVLANCVVQGIAASLRPLSDRFVMIAAREFASRAILRMRHLILPSSIQMPSDALPRLVCAFLALQQHHKQLKGLFI